MRCHAEPSDPRGGHRPHKRQGGKAEQNSQGHQAAARELPALPEYTNRSRTQEASDTDPSVELVVYQDPVREELRPKPPLKGQAQRAPRSEEGDETPCPAPPVLRNQARWSHELHELQDSPTVECFQDGRQEPAVLHELRTERQEERRQPCHFAGCECEANRGQISLRTECRDA